MADLNPEDDVDPYKDEDHLDSDIIPSLDKAIDIFADYGDIGPLDLLGVENTEGETAQTSELEIPTEAIDHGLPDSQNPLEGDTEKIKDIMQENNDVQKDAGGHGGLNDLNRNLDNACKLTVCGLGQDQFCKPSLNYCPLAPVITECDDLSGCDLRKVNHREESQNLKNKGIRNENSGNINEVNRSSDESGKPESFEKINREDESARETDAVTLDTDESLLEPQESEKLMKFLMKPISVPAEQRRQSLSCTLANVRSEFIDTNVNVTDSGLNSGQLEITKNFDLTVNNNNDDTFNAMSGKSSIDSKESSSNSTSLPATPRSSLSLPRPLPRRYSLADISNMGLSVVQDNAFEKEIRQHQLLLQNYSIRHSLSQTSIPESEELEDASETSSTPTVDLTSPNQRADYLRRRRASHGTIAPILPRLHLPRSPRASICEIPSEDSTRSSTPAINVIAAPNEETSTVSTSSAEEAPDDQTMSNEESEKRLMAYMRSKRRSSWACTGVHTDIKPITTMQLLKESKYYDGKLVKNKS